MMIEKGSIAHKAINVFTSATIFCGVYSVFDKAKSAETTKQLTNTTLVEYFTTNDYYTGFNNMAIAKAKLKSQNLTFQDTRMALSTRSKDDLTLPENTKRAIDLYNISGDPSMYINGINPHHEVAVGHLCDLDILKGIKTAKNFAKFEMVPKGGEKYTLKVTGVDPQLNKLKYVYFNAVAIENVVNVNYPNQESTVRNIVREYLIKDYKGKSLYLGKRISLNNGGTMTEDIQFNIPKGLKEKYSIVAWIQTEDPKPDPKKNDRNIEILSAATCRLGDGKILEFNWNNMPPLTLDEDYNVKKEYFIPLGLGEMNFNLKNAENLKTINFDMNKHDFRDKYKIVGIKPNPELFDVTSDQKYTRFNLQFHKPFTGNLENAITMIVDFKKQDDTSVGFRFCWLDIRNKDGNFPYVDMSGEPMRYGPNQLWISGYKPLDLNQDKKIDYVDVNELTKHFGRNSQDSNWDAKYDINQTGPSKDRIDILDLVTSIKAADAEATLRAEFHDNLKRNNIWDTGIIPICKIKSAKYGYDTRWNDVTQLLQEKLDKGNFNIEIQDGPLGGNPYPGALKWLDITYDDAEQKDFRIEIQQFSQMKFQKECGSTQSIEPVHLSNNKSENIGEIHRWCDEFDKRKAKQINEAIAL